MRRLENKSVEQLQKAIEQKLEMVSIFSDLIKKQKDILHYTHSMNGDGARDKVMDLHKGLLREYTRNRQKKMHSINILRAEIAHRQADSSETIHSSYESFVVPSEISDLLFMVLDYFPHFCILFYLYLTLSSTDIYFKLCFYVNDFKKKIMTMFRSSSTF
jgi:hypothetical protein